MGLDIIVNTVAAATDLPAPTNIPQSGQPNGHNKAKLITEACEAVKGVAIVTGEVLDGLSSTLPLMTEASRAIPGGVGAFIGTVVDAAGLAKCNAQIAKILEQLKTTLPGTYEALYLTSKLEAYVKQALNYSLGLGIDGLHVASTFVDLGIVSGSIAAGLAFLRLGAAKQTIATHKHQLNEMIKSYEKNYADKGLKPKEEYVRSAEEFSKFLEECEQLDADCEQALKQLESLEDKASKLDPQADQITRSSIEKEIQDTKKHLQKLLQVYHRKAAEIPGRTKKFKVISQNYEGIQKAKTSVIDLRKDLQEYRKHQHHKLAYEKAHPKANTAMGLVVLERGYRNNLSRAEATNDKTGKSKAQFDLKQLHTYTKTCSTLTKLRHKLDEKVNAWKEKEAVLQAKIDGARLMMPDLAQKGVSTKRAELNTLIQKKKGEKDAQSKAVVEHAEQSLKALKTYTKAFQELEKTQRRIERTTHLITMPEQELHHADNQKLMKIEKAKLEKEIAALDEERVDTYRQLKKLGNEQNIIDDDLAIDHLFDDVDIIEADIYDEEEIPEATIVNDAEDVDDDNIYIASFDDEVSEPKAFIIEDDIIEDVSIKKLPQQNKMVMGFLNEVLLYRDTLTGITKQVRKIPPVGHAERIALYDLGGSLKLMQRVLWDFEDTIRSRPAEFTPGEVHDCMDIIHNYLNDIRDLRSEIDDKMNQIQHGDILKLPSPRFTVPMSPMIKSNRLQEITVEV